MFTAKKRTLRGLLKYKIRNIWSGIVNYIYDVTETSAFRDAFRDLAARWHLIDRKKVIGGKTDCIHPVVSRFKFDGGKPYQICQKCKAKIFERTREEKQKLELYYVNAMRKNIQPRLREDG
jgi:hypothetical protein